MLDPLCDGRRFCFLTGVGVGEPSLSVQAIHFCFIGHLFGTTLHIFVLAHVLVVCCIFVYRRFLWFSGLSRCKIVPQSLLGRSDKNAVKKSNNENALLNNKDPEIEAAFIICKQFPERCTPLTSFKRFLSAALQFLAQ